MSSYRIFVGAFPTGDLAERIQRLHERCDPVTARITAPHVTLAGTYWRTGPATPDNEAETIDCLRAIQDRVQRFEEVATREGATGEASVTVYVEPRRIYLPVVLKNWGA